MMTLYVLKYVLYNRHFFVLWKRPDNDCVWLPIYNLSKWHFLRKAWYGNIIDRNSAASCNLILSLLPIFVLHTLGLFCFSMDIQWVSRTLSSGDLVLKLLFGKLLSHKSKFLASGTQLFLYTFCFVFQQTKKIPHNQFFCGTVGCRKLSAVSLSAQGDFVSLPESQRKVFNIWRRGDLSLTPPWAWLTSCFRGKVWADRWLASFWAIDKSSSTGMCWSEYLLTLFLISSVKFSHVWLVWIHL